MRNFLGFVWPFVAFAALLAVMVLAVIAAWPRLEECPACHNSVEPRPIYSMDDGVLRWKCSRCWFPIREEPADATD